MFIQSVLPPDYVRHHHLNKNSQKAKSNATQSCNFSQSDFHVSSFFLSLQIRELVPESQAYMDLLAFERKLDQTIMRKRLDIQEALKRPIKVKHLCLHSVKSPVPGSTNA